MTTIGYVDARTGAYVQPNDNNKKYQQVTYNNIYEEAAAQKKGISLEKKSDDDGRISVGEAVGSVVGGAVKGLAQGLWDIVTFKDPLKTVMAVGAVALAIACPPAGVAMCAVGAVTGGAQMVDGTIKAIDAYNDPNATDAEAKAAFEQIGSGALTVGLSVAGARAGIKGMQGVEGSAMQAAKGQGLTKNVLAYGKDSIASVKNGASAVKSAAVNGYESVKTAGDGSLLKGIKNTATNAFDDTAVGKYNTAKANYNKINNEFYKATDAAEEARLLAEVSKAHEAVTSAKAGIGDSIKGLPHQGWGLVKDAGKTLKANPTAAVAGYVMSQEPEGQAQKAYTTASTPSNRMVFTSSIDYDAINRGLNNINNQKILLDNGYTL